MIVPFAMAAVLALRQEPRIDDERLFKLIQESGDRWKEALAELQKRAGPRAPVAACGLYFIERDTLWRLQLVRVLVRLGRWRDVHEVSRPTDHGWGSNELVIDYLESAVALGKLPEAIREAERSKYGRGLNLSTSCFRR